MCESFSIENEMAFASHAMTHTDTYIESIFQRRREVFLRVLARRMGDWSEAEDTLQEAFIHFERASKNGSINNPDAYLMQIALNLAVDRLRQNSSRQRREENWFKANMDDRSGSEYASPIPAPDRILMARDELARLQGLLDGLSPKVRTAFILHKIEGLTHQETAEEMGISKSTVEKHIMKAMRYLMDNMAE